MKTQFRKQSLLINLGIIDLEDFYHSSVDNYTIGFQGAFDSEKVNKLKKKGFEFTLNSANNVQAERNQIRIVLT